MTADNTTIRTETNQAWNWFYHNHLAYLQAMVFLHQAISHIKSEKEIKDDLEKLSKSTEGLGMKPMDYFEANLFYSQVSGLELFFQRVIRCVIAAYPHKIGSVQFKLAQVVEAPSIDVLVDQAAEEYLNKLMYKKPADYLSEVCSLLSIEEDSLKRMWPGFVEAKARRDVGIHNNWICNDVYIRKVNEVGLQPTVKPGESLVPNTTDYIFKATNNLNNIAQEVHNAVVEKYV